MKASVLALIRCRFAVAFTAAIFDFTLCIVLAAPLPVLAQAFPLKPIRMISSPPAGSSGDVAGRLIANALGIRPN